MRYVEIDEPEMVRLFLGGTTQKQLAVRYGCSESLIQRRVHEHKILGWPTEKRAIDLTESVKADPDGPWQSRGLCNDYDPSLWDHDMTVRIAKNVCGKCLWRWTCLKDALDARDKHGVRGGLSGDERRRLLKRRDEAAA